MLEHDNDRHVLRIPPLSRRMLGMEVEAFPCTRRDQVASRAGQLLRNWVDHEAWLDRHTEALHPELIERSRKEGGVAVSSLTVLLVDIDEINE
jgi:hypothetical protein